MRQDESGGSGLRGRAGILPSLIAIALAATGCATTAPQTTAPPAHDPFEGTNRKMFDVGQALDHGIVRPIVGGYRRITPRPVRVGLHNLLQNLDEPTVLLNDVLQLHPKAAGKTALRFVSNTVFGIAGIFDPATKAGLPHHDNGFGSTLGRYGVGSGPYVYVPLLGATSLRDMVGDGVDFVSDPLSYVLPKAHKVTVTRTALSLLDDREQAEEDLRKLEAAADPYATLRSVYIQSREAEIKGPDAPLEALPEIPPEPAAPPPSEPAPQAAPQAAPVAQPAPPQ